MADSFIDPGSSLQNVTLFNVTDDSFVPMESVLRQFAYKFTYEENKKLYDLKAVLG